MPPLTPTHVFRLSFQTINKNGGGGGGGGGDIGGAMMPWFVVRKSLVVPTRCRMEVCINQNSTKSLKVSIGFS